MEYEILYRPSYSLLKMKLAKGEAVVAEAGAMVSMSSTVGIQTEMKGGLFGALKRSVLGGESFFMNTFTASDAGEITFAPPLPGDVAGIELKNQTVYVQSRAYLASTPGIQVDTKWGGAKTFFSKEGLFLLKISGTGHVFIASYGALHEVALAAGQKYIVDTGHMVEFAEGVNYAVKQVGGLKSTILSGEGLVCELTGPGSIMLQSRSEDAFLSWLVPHLPKQH